MLYHLFLTTKTIYVFLFSSWCHASRQIGRSGTCQMRYVDNLAKLQCFFYSLQYSISLFPIISSNFKQMHCWCACEHEQWNYICYDCLESRNIRDTMGQRQKNIFTKRQKIRSGNKQKAESLRQGVESVGRGRSHQTEPTSSQRCKWSSLRCPYCT